MRRYSLVRNDGRIWIEGPIAADAVSAAAIRRSLSEIEGTVSIVINTPGGCAAEGTAIYTALRESSRPIDVTIRHAHSMGVVIAMAGSSIRIVEAGTIGLHHCRYDGLRLNALNGTEEPRPATAQLLRRMARSLSTSAATKDEAERLTIMAARAEAIDATHLDILQRRTGVARVDLAKMRTDETVLNAAAAVELGFADEVVSMAGFQGPSYGAAPTGDARSRLVSRCEVFQRVSFRLPNLI